MRRGIGRLGAPAIVLAPMAHTGAPWTILAQRRQDFLIRAISITFSLAAIMPIRSRTSSPATRSSPPQSGQLAPGSAGHFHPPRSATESGTSVCTTSGPGQKCRTRAAGPRTPIPKLPPCDVMPPRNIRQRRAAADLRQNRQLQLIRPRPPTLNANDHLLPHDLLPPIRRRYPRPYGRRTRSAQQRWQAVEIRRLLCFYAQGRCGCCSCERALRPHRGPQRTISLDGGWYQFFRSFAGAIRSLRTAASGFAVSASSRSFWAASGPSSSAARRTRITQASTCWGSSRVASAKA